MLHPNSSSSLKVSHLISFNFWGKYSNLGLSFLVSYPHHLLTKIHLSNPPCLNVWLTYYLSTSLPKIAPPCSLFFYNTNENFFICNYNDPFNLQHFSEARLSNASSIVHVSHPYSACSIYIYMSLVTSSNILKLFEIKHNSFY